MDFPKREEFEKMSLTEKLEIIIKLMTTDKKDITFEGAPLETFPLAVGDIVRLNKNLHPNYLWGEKSLKNKTFKEERAKELFEQQAIVIQVNCGQRLKCNHCSHNHPVDILLYFPFLKKKYYTIRNTLCLVQK